jgi:hypothetical protein
VLVSAQILDHDRLISHDCCREPAAFIVDSSHAPDGV